MNFYEFIIISYSYFFNFHVFSSSNSINLSLYMPPYALLKAFLDILGNILAISSDEDLAVNLKIPLFLSNYSKIVCLSISINSSLC